METLLYLCHGIPPTMPLPPATANKLCFNSRRSSSLSQSSGRKKTLIECSGGRKLKRGASFQSTATKLGALKSLLDVMNCLDLHRSDTPNTEELPQQMEPEKAIEILKEEYQNCEKETLCDPFDSDIVYAEILICLGRFEEALKLDCLKESHPSDLRVKLYKAIIYTMLARSFWEEFWNSPEIPDVGDDVPIERED
ncbi:hypothetical protein SLA2020_326450 [Shorea laevis]